MRSIADGRCGQVSVDNNIRYQAKPNYIHRKVGGNDILIPVAENVADFNGFIELNSTSAFIWDKLATPHTINEVADAVADEFGADKIIAFGDTKELFDLMLEHNMLVEVG